MSDFIKEQRAQLRSLMKQKRHELDTYSLNSSSSVIFNTIASHPFLSQKRIIGSYSSFKNEIDMQNINAHLKALGHKVYLPVINSKIKGHMDFYSYDEHHLVVNSFGIKEPVALTENMADTAKLELLLVPMLAFDIKGNRLGMGGGYYDRILKRVSSDCLVIGIAHEFQKLQYIPVQSWDMPLDEAITEKEHYIFIKKY